MVIKETAIGGFVIPGSYQYAKDYTVRKESTVTDLWLISARKDAKITTITYIKTEQQTWFQFAVQLKFLIRIYNHFKLLEKSKK